METVPSRADAHGVGGAGAVGGAASVGGTGVGCAAGGVGAGAGGAGGVGVTIFFRALMIDTARASHADFDCSCMHVTIIPDEIWKNWT